MQSVQIKSIEQLSEGVLGIELVDPDGSPLPPWTPGAHIDLVLNKETVRQYSLCSDPADLTRYRIGVLLAAQGRGGSAYIHTDLAAGDEITIRGPRNHFELEPAENYIFIAGGIGITPLLPMIAEVARQGRTFTLAYGGRTSSSMAFTEELSGYGGRVNIVPEDEAGFIDLAALLSQPQANTFVYCCGPEPLIAAVETACAQWPSGSLHTERFASSPAVVEENAAPGDSLDRNTSFEVFLQQTGITLTVGADQSLLDVLDGAGADVYSDCREGTCSTCETPVLEGIVDHRDHVLSAKERASNDVMMVCVSRAACPRLVLDL